LPSELLQATDTLVKTGKVKSRAEFIAQAIKNELKALKIREIDAELAEMAQEKEYLFQVLKMEAEFASSSWEALQLGEKKNETR
jgi:metal-responsive CopG/Arc/MetJ family transcriptional regulator